MAWAGQQGQAEETRAELGRGWGLGLRTEELAMGSGISSWPIRRAQ